MADYRIGFRTYVVGIEEFIQNQNVKKYYIPFYFSLGEKVYDFQLNDFTQELKLTLDYKLELTPGYYSTHSAVAIAVDVNAYKKIVVGNNVVYDRKSGWSVILLPNEENTNEYFFPVNVSIVKNLIYEQESGEQTEDGFLSNIVASLARQLCEQTMFPAPFDESWKVLSALFNVEGGSNPYDSSNGFADFGFYVYHKNTYVPSYVLEELLYRYRLPVLKTHTISVEGDSYASKLEEEELSLGHVIQYEGVTDGPCYLASHFVNVKSSSGTDKVNFGSPKFCYNLGNIETEGAKVSSEDDLKALKIDDESDFYKVCKYVLGYGFPLYVYPVLAFNYDSDAIEKITHYLAIFSGDDVGPLLKEDITFLVLLLPFGEKVGEKVVGVDDDILSKLDEHLYIASTKDPDFESAMPNDRIGQLERYAFIGVKPDADVIREVRKQFTLTEGKRTAIITGNFSDVVVSPILSGKYTIKDQDGNELDATWQLLALQALLTYLISGDYTMPLTQKTIPGVNFSGTKLGTYSLSRLFNEGAMLLVSEDAHEGSAVCYRSILSSYGFMKQDNVLLSYPEDVELSILFVEDMMDKENREYLKQFRGQKLTTSMLEFIKKQFERVVLAGYIARGWMEAYADLAIWQDENDPTKIRGYYKYRPIYPINKIWVEHFFVV